MARAKKSKAEAIKNLKSLMNGINKKANETIIGFANDNEIAESIKIEFLPTKSHALNEAFGGYPLGKLTIITGMADCGKTSRILEDIGYNMKLDPEAIFAWVESEGSLSQEMIDLFEIDRERFIIYQVDPNTGAEEAMDICISLAEAGVRMIAINSLRCLTPSKEFKDSVGDANIGLQARINAKFMRKVIPVLDKSGTALVCTQHKSTNIGKMFGDPMELSGGHALRYNSMLILDLTKLSIQKGDMYYDMKNDVIRVKCKVQKNHCCATKNPYVSAEYTVIIGKGTDERGEIIQAAFDMGLVEKQGAWIRIYPDGVKHDKGNELVLNNGDVCKFNGMSAYMDYLNSTDELYEFLKARVEGNVMSSVQSLSDEEIDILERNNNGEITEEEMYEQLEEIVESTEEE